MYIAINSEVDSRVILYPLMKVLKSYGSVLVVSSNKQLNRLIDDDVEGGFRNIRIIVEESGATDDVYEAYGIASDDFDFVVLDNMGAVDYDLHIIPLGAKHSESFDEDVKMLLEDEPEKTKLIQFGKPAKGSASKDSKDTKKEERPRGKRGKDQTDLEDYDPAEKFDKNAENLKKAKNANIKPVMVPFPTYQNIEDVEGEHKFYEVPANLINVFYDMLKDTIVVDRQQFRKEVIKKDESSGYIKSRNSTREE